MTHPPEHTVLDLPFEYDIVDFRYHVDRYDNARSYIDIGLEKPGDMVQLRFWGPQKLVIEDGFPNATGGMIIYDISSYEWENIGVEVADFESARGAVTFYAKSVERIIG
jgi:hypothetical protein